MVFQEMEDKRDKLIMPNSSSQVRMNTIMKKKAKKKSTELKNKISAELKGQNKEEETNTKTFLPVKKRKKMKNKRRVKVKFRSKLNHKEEEDQEEDLPKLQTWTLIQDKKPFLLQSLDQEEEEDHQQTQLWTSLLINLLSKVDLTEQNWEISKEVHPLVQLKRTLNQVQTPISEMMKSPNNLTLKMMKNSPWSKMTKETSTMNPKKASDETEEQQELREVDNLDIEQWTKKMINLFTILFLYLKMIKNENQFFF